MNLIRPVNFQAVMVFDAAGQSAFRAALFTLPIAVVVAILFHVRPPVSLAAGALFAVSATLSFFLVAGLNFLVGLIAIRTKSIMGILRAKFLVLELLSGLLIPTTLFPEPFDPSRVTVPSHQLHARHSLPGQGHGRRSGPAPAGAGGLDRRSDRRGAMGLVAVATPHHDPGRLSSRPEP
jgi:hypothetical protein